MDCVDEDEADIEEVEEVGGCPILTTGLCKSSELSMREGGGGWGGRDESVGRLLLFPPLVPLVLVLLVLLLLLLQPFLEGGLLGLLLLLGDRSLSIAA